VDSVQEKWITDTNCVLVFTLDVAANSTEGAAHMATQIEEWLKFKVKRMNDAPEVKVYLPGNDIVRICLGMDDEDGFGFDEDLFQGPMLQFIESFSSTLEWGLNVETLTENLETVTVRDLFALRGVTRLGDITPLVDQMRPLANKRIRELKDNLDLVRIPFVTPVFEENKLENDMSENLSEILNAMGQVAQESGMLEEFASFSLKHGDHPVGQPQYGQQPMVDYGQPQYIPAQPIFAPQPMMGQPTTLNHSQQWLGTDGKLTQDEAKLKQILCPEYAFYFAPQLDITITSKGKTLAIDPDPDQGVVAVDSVSGSMLGLKFLLTSVNKTRRAGHLFFLGDGEKVFLTSTLDRQSMADSDSLVELTQSSTGWVIKYPNKGSGAPAWIAMDPFNNLVSVPQEYADWNVSLPTISTPFVAPRPFAIMVTNEDDEDCVIFPDGKVSKQDDISEEDEINCVYNATVIDNKTYLVNASGAKLLNCAWTIQGGSANALDMPILQILKPFMLQTFLTGHGFENLIHELHYHALFLGEFNTIHIRNAEGKGITCNITNVGSIAKLAALLDKCHAIGERAMEKLFSAFNF
jgi:hypothetical protein